MKTSSIALASQLEVAFNRYIHVLFFVVDHSGYSHCACSAKIAARFVGSLLTKATTKPPLTGYMRVHFGTQIISTKKKYPRFNPFDPSMKFDPLINIKIHIVVKKNLK